MNCTRHESGTVSHTGHPSCRRHLLQRRVDVHAGHNWINVAQDRLAW